MPSEAKGRLSLVVFSGTFERVHYAIAMAAAALAIGRPATLFFTMGAIRALEPDEGWRRLPSEDGRDGAAIDAEHAQRGVGRFGELLDAVLELGGTLMVCDMGLRAIGLTRAQVRADLPIREGGIVTFLGETDAGGTTLFI